MLPTNFSSTNFAMNLILELIWGLFDKRVGSGYFSSRNSKIAPESEIIKPSIDKHGTVAVGEKAP